MQDGESILVALLIMFTLFSIGLEHFIKALRSSEFELRKHIIWTQVCWGVVFVMSILMKAV